MVMKYDTFIVEDSAVLEGQYPGLAFFHSVEVMADLEAFQIL